uniref:DNA-directed RNA polymerase subunit beta n=1 Tax=candidate division WOR-3 bacterium TaxID=2052148 RepID=A0A7V0Z567_UNCW3
MNNIIDFSKNKVAFDMPHLLEIQTESYKKFRDVALGRIFNEAFPVIGIHNKYELRYISHRLGAPKYSVQEAIEKGVTYSLPLRVSFQLLSKEENALRSVIEQEIYLCDLPLMTHRGTFIINGVERVIVNQIHRSPGVYFSEESDNYSAMVIPYHGQWIEFIVDPQNILWAILDRKKRISGTLFLKSLGYIKNEDIVNLFYTTKVVDLDQAKNYFLAERFEFDDVQLEVLDLIDETNYEILKDNSVKKVKIVDAQDAGLSILANTIKKDPEKISNVEDAARKIYSLLRSIPPPTPEFAINYINDLLFNKNYFDLGEVGRFKINQRLDIKKDLTNTTFTKDDLIKVLKELLRFANKEFEPDDIDHLGNRRVRRVGELLETQFKQAINQLIQSIKEKASLMEEKDLTPQDLINPHLVSNILMKFFTTSQLSQFMEQTNPISEMTHKRRISSLGQGGLTRQTAGFEVRDVHYSHYGRICPIETPEGPNIGLISSLSSYARIDEYGFIVTPYWEVKNGVVKNKFVYLRADEEDKYTIAQANTPVDKNGKILADRVLCRRKGEFPMVPPEEVDYMDVSPEQVFSPTASLIPFLEHDDADRALMGSNMQRQAVPLIDPDIPFVQTGMESKVARDSGTMLIADDDGVVDYVDANQIVVKNNKGRKIKYQLSKFLRSNQNTCINQRPLVKIGDTIKKGQILADGYATKEGVLALGKNVLVAFLPYLGYNFEDAVVVSERLLRDDTFTSIHILEFDCEVRETKLGPEEITRDIPGIPETMCKDLDQFGIVRIGAEVGPDDILVGKITPKGESELTPEERLMRAIFVEKSTNVRDTSLRVEPGVEGVVIDVRVLTRRTTDPLAKAVMEEREKKIKQDFIQAHNEIIAARNESLKQLLKDQTALSTIRDDKERVILKKGQTFDDEFFNNLATEKITADDKFVDNEKLNEKIIKLINEYQEILQQLKADEKIEKDKLMRGDELPYGVLKIVKVYIAQKRKISVGDKMAGRHGNKGVVAKIVPEEDMPYLADGTPIDIVLNPLGVPSRMNVGQILETHLGWAADKIKFYALSPVFNGATVGEIKEKLKEAGLPESGQVTLYDGRTGMQFDSEVTVGYMYMLKLIHMVDEKMHARSSGPYSLITQQPLGGKAQFGGQRLGEMEVWALEAYGAAYSLQEMLTVKSDDVDGRAAMYEALIRGKNPPKPRAPASFNVLLKELQGLCLNVSFEKKEESNEA